jgi:hypothetical protein
MIKAITPEMVGFAIISILLICVAMFRSKS